MKNATTKKALFTIAAAMFLLIPGATAVPGGQAGSNQILKGDGNNLPTHCSEAGPVAIAVDVFDDPCAQTCEGVGNVNIVVTMTGDTEQCTKHGGDKVTCVANINIAVNLYGEVQQCTSNGPGGSVTCMANVNIVIQWVTSSVDQCVAIVEDAVFR